MVWRRRVTRPVASVPLLMVTATLAFILGRYTERRTLDPGFSLSSKSNLSVAVMERSVQKSSCQLMLFVLSAVNNKERRHAARETFLRPPHKRSTKIEGALGKSYDLMWCHVFVLGTASLSQSLLSELEEEEAMHSDLLLLSHVRDVYSELTSKLLNGLVALLQLYNFDFVLKIDDDSFVNVPKVLDELRSQAFALSHPNDLYWGFFDGRAPVNRNSDDNSKKSLSSKWQELHYELCDNYVPYALGGGYVLSYALVAHLVSSKSMLKLYHNEDAAMGSWLAGLDVHRVHDVRFDTEYRSRGCSNRYLVSHKQSVQDMWSKQYNLDNNNGNMCEKEFVVRKSYQYDWNAKPSLCCKRVDGLI